MGAYDHSFLPSATGKYIIQLVRSGWELDRAKFQAAIEHGREQAEEIDRLLNKVQPDGQAQPYPRATARGEPGRGHRAA